MERRTFLKSLALTIPALYSGQLLALSSSNVSTIIAKKLNLNLSTAGRLGFYIDYSERSSLGEHTFYVCRTHGTQGRVSVDYATYGDPHQTVSGTLIWEAGEADIKSFTVNVSSKSNGEHRIYAQLLNPVGGAVLHNGDYTRAYGVIDDDTIASDANAVFYDAQAGTNGNGTKANPYNNVYDAIANISNKRYLYGKGVTVPDGTHSVNPNGGGGIADCIFIPTGRTDEETRLFIRNWPGFGWTISGGGANNKIGFYSDGPRGTVGDSSYVTFRGINFSNLDCSGKQYCEGGGIGYFKNGGSGVNVELCTFDNINGSTNTSGFNAYQVDGGKIWRCASNNIKVNGSNTNLNAGGLCLYYGATNLSFQRCETTNAGCGFYFKRMEANEVLPVVRFCKIKTRIGIEYGFGSTTQEANYAIVQGNLFKNCTSYTAISQRGAGASAAGKNLISNNVFDNCGGGDNGAIYMSDAYGHLIYNNIFYKCRKMWDVPEAISNQSNQSKDVIEYADYNHDYGTTSVRYEYLSIKYSTSAALSSASGHAPNDSTGDPLFSNPAIEDYTLKSGSPCIGNGIDGVNQGIYLVGIEKLGVSGAMISAKQPSAPTGLSVM